MKERAQLERQYAKGLAKVVGKMKGALDGKEESQICQAMGSVMQSIQNRGEQSEQLAEEIEQDVVTTFDDMLRQHAEVTRQIAADGRRVLRLRQEVTNAHERSLGRYRHVCR